MLHVDYLETEKKRRLICLWWAIERLKKFTMDTNDPR